MGSVIMPALSLMRTVALAFERVFLYLLVQGSSYQKQAIDIYNHNVCDSKHRIPKSGLYF